jgi:hypothetical protein
MSERQLFLLIPTQNARDDDFEEYSQQSDPPPAVAGFVTRRCGAGD